MASVSTDTNGSVRILLVGNDRKRKAVRLGKVNQKTAGAVKLKVEHLHNAGVTKSLIDPDTARWVAGIGDKLAAKLAAVGLIPERPKAVTFAGLLDLYGTEKEAGNKPGTRTNHRTITNDLNRFFKPTTDPRTITDADAMRFLDHLRERDLASYTVARRVRRVRSIFAFGVKAKMLTAKPPGDQHEIGKRDQHPQGNRVSHPLTAGPLAGRAGTGRSPRTDSHRSANSIGTA